MYDSTNSEKTAGLDNIHFGYYQFDRSGRVGFAFDRGALPYQIKADTSNLDNNSDTEQIFVDAMGR